MANDMANQVLNLNCRRTLSRIRKKWLVASGFLVNYTTSYEYYRPLSKLANQTQTNEFFKDTLGQKIRLLRRWPINQSDYLLYLKLSRKVLIHQRIKRRKLLMLKRLSGRYK